MFHVLLDETRKIGWNFRMDLPQIIFVLDVESVGLHGEGFAFGAVVIDTATGKELAAYQHACSPLDANGSSESDLTWVLDNVRISDDANDCLTPAQVRNVFWGAWLEWKSRGAVMFGDCAWPVEARFLSACVSDGFTRYWEGPYPLHDIATILLALGIDPLKKFARLPHELPEHNPLNDARQSARVLLEAAKTLKP